MTSDPTKPPEPTGPEPNPSEQRIIDLGKENWRTKKAGADWAGWVHIGQAIDVGRSYAMRIAHSNLPKGRAYSEAFGLWLKRNGFEDMDQVLRAALLECISNLLAIEAWRKTLAENQRLEWNNPRTVLKRWQASHKIPAGGDKAPVSSPVAQLKAKIAELETELHQIRQRGDGSMFAKNDTAKNIGKLIEDEFRGQASRLRTLGRELLKRADVIDGKEPKE